MGRSSKNKKNKVPKITEEEYNKYISALKAAPAQDEPERGTSATEIRQPQKLC